MPLCPGYLTSVTLTIGYENCTCEGDMNTDPRHYTHRKRFMYIREISPLHACVSVQQLEHRTT